MKIELKNNWTIRILSSLSLTAVALIWLIFLVIWGTIYQSFHGLYAAQQHIFAAWFFFAGGWFPVPAMLTAGVILLVNILAALLFRLKWTTGNLGLILAHAGLLLFLAGGFYINDNARESYLTLAEGESGSMSTAAHEWELAVFKSSGENSLVNAVDSDDLKPGKIITFTDFDLEIAVQEYFKNARIIQPKKDSAGAMPAIEPLPPAPEPSENIPAGKFEIRNENKTERLVLSGQEPGMTAFSFHGQPYQISLRLRRYPLPVQLKLLDFQKDFYPGSGIPKSFSSRVEIKTPEYERHAIISMNQPLRYRDLTFYQSSYGEFGGNETSTLSVVKNSGRWLPYIASGLTCLGLAFHYILIYFIRPRFRKIPG